MSRILVAYASSHGHTHTIADALAARLRARGHTVELADAGVGSPPPPEDYDTVVLGSRIHTGTHAPSIAQYVRTHRAALARMPTAFFSVSMSAAQVGAGPDPHGYLATFFAAVAWQPTRATAFGGRLAYREYNWLLRLAMKYLSRKGGHATDTSRDHVYTDWAAVDRFADEIAGDTPFVPPEEPVTVIEAR